MTWSRVGLPAVIVLMALTFAVLNPNFSSAVNVRNVARQSAILSLTACGQTIVILSGGFDLSLGMVIGLISVAGSLVMAQTGLWTGMLAGLAVGVAIGTINGVMVAKMHLPPFIATLAMLSAARGLALILSGGLPITDLPTDFRWLGAGQVLTLPLPAVIAAIVFVGCHLLMKKTRFGRYVYAIGGNEEAATYAGVPVARYKMSVWALHGLLVGVAAVVLTSRAVSGHATLGEGAEHRARARARQHQQHAARRARDEHPHQRPQSHQRVDVLPDGGDGRDHRGRRLRGPVASQSALRHIVSAETSRSRL